MGANSEFASTEFGNAEFANTEFTNATSKVLGFDDDFGRTELSQIVPPEEQKQQNTSAPTPVSNTGARPKIFDRKYSSGSGDFDPFGDEDFVKSNQEEEEPAE